MSGHPEELLAGYVDGTLDAEDRARVESHVSSCARCRQEVDLASEARRSLAGLPELEPPPGITFGVLRESRTRRLRPGLGWKLATGAAAAAVIVTGVVVIATGPRQGLLPQDAGAPDAERARPTEEEAQGDAGAERASPSELRAPATEPQFSVADRDYDLDLLARQGQRLRDQARVSLQAGFPEPAAAFYERYRVSDFPPAARAAAGCILEELPPRQLAVPFVIQEATFQGEPVYVAAFLQGPDPDQPYDRLLLWVLDREDCGLRYYATVRL